MNGNEKLREFISTFEKKHLIDFFRLKTTSFNQADEGLQSYDDKDFADFQKIGEIKFERETQKLVIISSKVQNALSERSGKKAQYKKGFLSVMVYLGKEIKMNTEKTGIKLPTIDNTKERIFTKASKVFEMILKESNVGFSDVNSKSNVKEIVLMVNKMAEWFNQNT